MVVNNTCSAIGDVLFIESKVPFNGAITLTSFTDTLVGETGTRYFEKIFRYSFNGILYGDWQPLTNLNLSAVSGTTANGLLYLQFRYKRIGSDTTGLLEFVDMLIDGSTVATICNSETIHNSIFDKFACSNPQTAEICDNLLKKLYESGIVPEFIERGEGIDDQDYIDFWSAVSCYFAMLLSYAEQFENIFVERHMLIKHLKDRNIFFCEDSITLDNLQFLSQFLYDEMRKRSTIQIFKKKDEVLEDLSVVPIDGEFLRILCHDLTNEFLYEVTKLEQIGWNVGHSSPMYKGLEETGMIKGYEKTKGFVDLAKYNISSTNTPSIVTDGSRIGCLQIVVNPGEEIRILDKILDLTKLLPVSPTLDYEVSFEIKANSKNFSMSFGTLITDKDYNDIPPLECESGADEPEWVSHSSGLFPCLVPSVFYKIRGVLFNKDSAFIGPPESLVSVFPQTTYISGSGQGKHLRFYNPAATFIQPFLFIKNNDVSAKTIKLYNFKIKPLRTQYSNCFLNTFGIIRLFIQNNNKKLNGREIKEIARHYLLPYEAIPIYTWMIK